MKMQLVTFALLVISCPIAYAEIELLNLMVWFAPKDTSRYAAKMADTIQDKPDCQKLTFDIMAHAKGSPTDGKTVEPIVTAKQKAIIAGCAK